METDINKIRNHAKKNENENWSFRTFLKNYGDKDLDSIVHELFNQISKEIDCTSCGNCCMQIRPILKNKDINNLAKSLNISAEKFISKYIEKDEDGDNLINKIPCPFLIDTKCTQYDSRPSDCSSYPHLQKKDFVHRLIDVVNNYSICPIVFNVYEVLKNELKSEFIEFQEEFSEFEYY